VFRTLICTAIASLAVSFQVLATECGVTAQRPSLSFNALPVAGGDWEIEVGAAVADGESALPVFVKYGATERVEIETDSGSLTSIGELNLGARVRLGRSRGGTSFAAPRVNFRRSPPSILLRSGPGPPSWKRHGRRRRAQEEEGSSTWDIRMPRRPRPCWISPRARAGRTGTPPGRPLSDGLSFSVVHPTERFLSAVTHAWMPGRTA
jgi:hypothetical protein